MKIKYLFILLCITLQLSSCSNQKNNKQIVWKETVGILYHHGYKSGTIYYTVDGKDYTGEFLTVNEEAVKNEKYTMRYNVNKPEQIEVDYWNPVFEKGEKTFFLKAKIIKVQGVSIWSPKAAVIYEFKGNGETFRRWGYLPPNYKEKYPNLKEGQYYELELWMEDTNRLVLHLDRPLKDTINMR